MGLKHDLNPHAVICQVSGKERLTKGEAKSAAKRVKSRRYGNISAYRCRACHGWHIGNRQP
jgi:hypothetical protein